MNEKLEVTRKGFRLWIESHLQRYSQEHRLYRNPLLPNPDSENEFDGLGDISGKYSVQPPKPK